MLKICLLFEVWALYFLPVNQHITWCISKISSCFSLTHWPVVIQCSRSHWKIVMYQLFSGDICRCNVYFFSSPRLIWVDVFWKRRRWNHFYFTNNHWPLWHCDAKVGLLIVKKRVLMFEKPTKSELRTGNITNWSKIFNSIRMRGLTGVISAWPQPHSTYSQRELKHCWWFPKLIAFQFLQRSV